MSEKHLRVCNKCGKEEPMENAWGSWVRVEYLAWGKSHFWDFCDFDCLVALARAESVQRKALSRKYDRARALRSA